jgi:hypothetical protein
VALHATALGTN